MVNIICCSFREMLCQVLGIAVTFQTCALKRIP